MHRRRLAPLFVEMAVAVYLIGYYLTCLVFVIDLEAYLAVSLLSQLALSFLLVCFLRRSLVAKRIWAAVWNIYI